MPARWLCVVIVVVWLATTGRLIVEDLLPRLLPGTPPSYTIELTEEADQERAHVFWNLLRDGEKVMAAKTRVRHVARGEFELSATYEPVEKGKAVPLSGVLVRHMTSAYRVNAAGDLLGVRVEIDGRPDLADWLKVVNADFKVTIAGEVESGRMAPDFTLRAVALERKMRLPEVAVPRAALLLPLHPVNRLRDPSPGQAWTTRLFDPVVDSLSALQGLGGEPRLLRARVRARPEELPERLRTGEPCLVIDYQGEEFRGATWVGTRTGLVWMQEATQGKTRWTMVRD